MKLYYTITTIHNTSRSLIKSQISRSDLDPSFFHEKYYIAAAASSISKTILFSIKESKIRYYKIRTYTQNFWYITIVLS